MSEPCSQAETIAKIEQHLAESAGVQQRMVDTMIALAEQGEKIISIADKTAANQDNINKLFRLTRSVETRLIEHIAAGHNASVQEEKSADKKFDKVQVSIITAIALTVVHSLWDILSGLVETVHHLLAGVIK